MRALLTAFLMLPLFGQSTLPKGVMIPKVLCKADPGFSYALYLPSGYTEDRPWPVLFAFSPGGNGEDPVRLFQKAAEQYGWIVVGSHDSRNGPLRPALKASEVLWKEVLSRFKVHPRTCASAGFSGGARMALRLARQHPEQVTGLISIGAFGTGDGLLSGLSKTTFYLMCGREDFNHWEVLQGREELASRKWLAMADRFEGGHRWPQEDQATTALAFLEIGAARKGLVPRDPQLEATFRQHLQHDAERAGSTLLGLRRYQELAHHFPDTAEGKLASQNLVLLEQDPGLQAERKLEEVYRKKSGELGETRGNPRHWEILNSELARLRTAPPVEREMIRRVLGLAMAEHWMALEEAVEHKNWVRLLAAATNLARLDEREPAPCIWMSVALARLDRLDQAVQSLKEAQGRGYRDPGRLRTSASLAPLRGRADFEAVLRSMESATVPQADPTP